MATNTDGDIIIGTKLDNSDFQNGLNKMAGTAAKGATAVAAAIGAMSAAVIALGSEFESANVKASTLFGDAQVDMTQYQGKMLELSTKTGLAASELGNTMYDALSAGIPASDDMSEAMGFLEKNTKLAKAGFTDINTATTATAKVLNAYKMDVSETDRVHKILMQTQNKGITTVNELGSVLSQVTPTASAMNVAFEQVGAALANMTAQGTPTAQATTQLNQLFAELGKSGTKGQEGLMKALEGSKYAGKGFSDLMKEGVPLNEILDLMDTYASKNKLSLLDMFSSIEAGKAALAVSGQNSKQFTENLKAMGTEVDVVGEAYDKVTNTFEEKSKKAVNSLKNVGIAAYDKFKEPLSKAMDAAQKSIDSLSKSLSSGKMGKSIDKIAEGFGRLIEVAIDLASKTIPILINAFSFMVDNGQLVIGTITAISAAMFVYNNYQTITTSLQTAGAVASLAYGTAQAVMAGQITLAQGAMELFNLTMLSNPIALATAAVAGLTAAIAVLAINSDLGKTKSQELMETIDQQANSLKEAHAAAKERADDAMFEINNLQTMKGELDNIVDANGRVVAGFEDRASFLVNELAQATGLDIELVDGQIKNYGELSGEIDKTIEKMKAEALLAAYKDEYIEALKNQKDAQKALREATEDYNKVFGESNKEMQDFIKNHTDNLIKQGVAEKEAREQAKNEWQQRNKDVYDALKDAEKNYDNYTKTIVNYDQAKTEALKGNFGGVEEMLNADSSAHEKNLEKKRELMKNEIDELIYKNESLASIRTDANAETVDAEIAHNNKMVLEKRLGLIALQNEVWAATPQYEEAYKYLSDMGAEAFDENGNLVPAAQAKIDEAKNAVLGWTINYSDALAELADDGEKAFDENGNLTPAAQKKILDAKIAAGEFSFQYINVLKELADAGEAIYDENGNLTVAAQKKIADAYAKIHEVSPEYAEALKKVAKDGQLEFDRNGELTEASKKKVDEAIKTLDKKKGDMKAPGKALGDKTGEGYKSADFESSGNYAVDGLAKGASSKGSLAKLWNAGISLANSLLGGVKSKGKEGSPWKTTIQSGKWAAEGLAIGAESNQDIVNEAGKNLVDGFLDTVNSSEIELSDILGKMDLAIANEQLRMSADSRIQAEYKVGKAVAELKQDKQPLKATLEANITVANNIDGREAGIALAPFIAEEIEFI
ncbi:phage tail tape measure protein [Thomasclavelia cocleata]|uniref:phage tail tape measure protein n=1 Tax=Thomasclavelia cocleata TaxID=69824 RepID=UPI00242F6761|nr:phage tail tape measure protein [Thomasclavelia cocleata]